MTAPAATDDFQPVSRFFPSQGLDLHYLDWGNDGAPLLLLLHGSRDHARSWDWTARALRHRWHVIAPDLRGHGDSGWSRDGAYLTVYHALDIAGLIGTLGERQLDIVAHSFGGGVAIRYAATFPDRVRKLVLVDGLGPSPKVQASWDRQGPVRRTREWIDNRLAAAARGNGALRRSRKPSRAWPRQTGTSARSRRVTSPFTGYAVMPMAMAGNTIRGSSFLPPTISRSTARHSGARSARRSC